MKTAEKTLLIVGIFVVVIIALISISINHVNPPMIEYCHAVWEGKYSDAGAGISLHMHYEPYCGIFETKEDCENSIDFLNYSISGDSFNEGGDGLPDCEWR